MFLYYRRMLNRKGSGMKKETRRLQITITVVAVALAIIHIAIPSIGIDAIATSLFLVAVVPWLYPLFKSVELPGGVKFEFQDLENIIERAKLAGLVEFRGGGGDPYLEEFAFLYAAKENEQVLALSGFRLEIEEKLRKLAVNYDVVDRYSERPVRIEHLIDLLTEVEALSLKEGLIIKKLINVLDIGIQSPSNDERTMEVLASSGPEIIWALETKVGKSAKG